MQKNEVLVSYDALTESFEETVRAKVAGLVSLFDEKDIAEIGSDNCARIALMLAVCEAGSEGFFLHDSDSRRIQQRIQRRTLREAKSNRS